VIRAKAGHDQNAVPFFDTGAEEMIVTPGVKSAIDDSFQN
jgi:hypothetical protein